MNKHTVWSWIAAATLSVGFVGTAGAESYDRDHEVGRGRSQDVRQQVNAREAAPTRPSTDKSVTGREMGRDSLSKGSIGREFKSAADVSAHLNTQTMMRASNGGESEDGFAAPKAARPSANMSAVAALTNRSKQSKPVELDDQMTENEQTVEGKSASGKTLGQDTITKGMASRDYKSREDMMSQMSMQTKMRMSGGEASADGEVASASSASAAKGTSNPATMSDKTRASLCREGACIGKKASSSDIEDKDR